MRYLSLSLSFSLPFGRPLPLPLPFPVSLSLHLHFCAHTEERPSEGTAIRQPSTGQENNSHQKLNMDGAGTQFLDFPASRTVQK